MTESSRRSPWRARGGGGRSEKASAQTTPRKGEKELPGSHPLTPVFDKATKQAIKMQKQAEKLARKNENPKEKKGGR